MTRRSSFPRVLLFFGIFWMTIVGSFDALIGFNIYRQKRAERFPSVIGRIVSSEVTRHHDSDGSTYGADILFEYEVDGQTHTSGTYRFGAFSTSNSARAAGIVGRYPAGKDVEVFYDPDDPDRAVLETGVEEIDFMFLLFLTPFNIVGIGVCLIVGQAMHRRMSDPVAGGVPVIRRELRTHVRLPRITPFYAAGGTALGISFIAVFVLAFGFGFEPSFTTLNVTWGLIALASAAVYFQRRFVVGSGAKDLIIDDETKTLSLPQTFGRKNDVIVPRDSVDNVNVEVLEHRGSKGGVSHTHAPTLLWTDASGAARKDRLADWHDPHRARDFAAWLRQRLDLTS